MIDFSYEQIIEIESNYLNAKMYKFRLEVSSSPYGDSYTEGLIVLRQPFDINIYRGDIDELMSEREWEDEEYYPKE